MTETEWAGDTVLGTAERSGSLSPSAGLVVVVGGALLAQGLSIYTYEHVRLGAGFYPVTFAARLLVPLVVGLGLLGMRPRDLGLARPRLSRGEWGMLAGALVLIPLAALPVLGLDSYQAAYSVRRSQTPDLASAITSFVAFTVSTTLVWELLHRGLLLHASRRLLERGGLASAVAMTAAIVIVWSFEVLFHFVKPPVEAVAMALASPVLSWLALRTRSLLVPVLLHLEVEIVFFLVVLR